MVSIIPTDTIPATAQDIIKVSAWLVGRWTRRQYAFRKWYNLIKLTNDLQQENMESVISADPRIGYNMAKWLLTPRTWTFVADAERLSRAEQQKIGLVEAYANRQLASILSQGRVSLFSSALARLLGLLLSTGWYSVLTYPFKTESGTGWMFDVWNPAQVFPHYSDAGTELLQVVRVYRMRVQDIARRAPTEGWNYEPRGHPDSLETIRCYWTLEPAGVFYSVVIGQQLARPLSWTPFNRIPVLVGPVFGLPDDGSIMEDDSWTAEIGESIIAPIRDIQKNYDKMLTYVHQLVRDTANPRWIEKVNRLTIDPERLFDRGYVISIKPGEDAGALATPPLPMEIQTHLQALRGQIQRGLFSDASFGNVTQQVSVFLMSQIIASAKQVLEPFHIGLKNLLGEMATRNVHDMVRFGLNPTEWPSVPRDLVLNFDYDIEIPGDFLHRANAAKIINPNFKLPFEDLIRILFPEIKNPMVVEGKVLAEDARQNPLFRQLVLIREMHQAALEAGQLNDTEFAALLTQLAEMLTQQLAQPATEQISPTGRVALPAEIEEMVGRL